MKSVYCLWQITTDEFENQLEYLEGIYSNKKVAQKALKESIKNSVVNEQDFTYTLTERELRED